MPGVEINAATGLPVAVEEGANNSELATYAGGGRARRKKTKPQPHHIIIIMPRPPTAPMVPLHALLHGALATARKRRAGEQE